MIGRELCDLHITNFFQTALNHIRAGRVEQAQTLLNGLSEPNETCLGVSKGAPAGRGVSGKQAFDLYDALAASQAARTGILEELAECELFIPGIGSDKISDVTTNIIRRPLIEYTQAQCDLHGIVLNGTYPSGRFWDIEASQWRQTYVSLPIYAEKRLILVPKYTVRRHMSLDSQEFYSKHILNFIQQEELERRSSLVRVLANGERRPPSKKVLRDVFPFSKDFITRFSEAHPDVLADYKSFYSELENAGGTLKHDEFNEEFDESVFARLLATNLPKIPPGNFDATRYHSFIMGVLEFIFWPNLIYPKKEHEIEQGRKRIDITYTNAAQTGFFWRAHTSQNIASRLIMVECKNYNSDPANPELDQLAGRFSINRGQLGLLLYRSASDYNRLCERCRDAAQAGRGVMLPFGDDQVIEFLNLIASGQRSEIDARLQSVFLRLIS